MLFDPIPAASARARAFGAAPLSAGFDAWFQRAVTRDPKDRFRDAAHPAEVARAGGRRRALQRALHAVGTEEDKRRIQQQIDALRGDAAG